MRNNTTRGIVPSGTRHTHPQADLYSILRFFIRVHGFLVVRLFLKFVLAHKGMVESLTVPQKGQRCLIRFKFSQSLWVCKRDLVQEAYTSSTHKHKAWHSGEDAWQ